MRAGLPAREPDWLARWERLGIYHRLRETAHGRPAFELHDGPPYANGHLHIGHALNKVLKDFVVRSRQMMGHDSRYVPGWDCHGLPIEWKIEEQYRARGKSKDEVPINELRAECRRFAEHWVGVQREEFKRLGVTGDWENPYLTMDFHAEAVIADEFMKFVDERLALPRLQARHVVAGREDRAGRGRDRVPGPPEPDDLGEVPRRLTGRFARASGNCGRCAAFLGWLSMRRCIWTTTPWTIPSNRGVAFNPAASTTASIEVTAAPAGELGAARRPACPGRQACAPR